MSAQVETGEGADLIYRQALYHGDLGGIEVSPRTTVRLGPRARYRADPSPVEGPVERLDTDQGPLSPVLLLTAQCPNLT